MQTMTAEQAANSSAILLDAAPGLDCLIEIGPRGGKRKFWRRVEARTWQAGIWSPTQKLARQS